jgi:hypothetical protein
MDLISILSPIPRLTYHEAIACLSQTFFYFRQGMQEHVFSTTTGIVGVRKSMLPWNHPEALSSFPSRQHDLRPSTIPEFL